MPTLPPQDPAAFRPVHATFVGVDSDGCVFDTMEVKQKCHFHPAIIRRWGLEAIEPQVRAAAEFVYLYSVHRGVNRFIGLCKVFELLREWPEAAEQAEIPDPADLRAYCESGLPLDNNTLRREAERTGSPLLFQVLEWSEALNEDIARNMPPPPPFRGAVEALPLLAKHSDVGVVSQTQASALLADWRREKLDRYVLFIAGPEQGSKRDCLEAATKGRYRPEAVLLIGDAPGDQVTAEAVGCRFFPINPGREEESWRRFIDEAYPRFLRGEFDDTYQGELVAAFRALLPETPPWKRKTENS